MQSEWFIQKAIGLEVGEVARSEDYAVHKYSDGWWVFWNDPRRDVGNLGFLFRQEAQLNIFLRGGNSSALIAKSVDVFSGRIVIRGIDA